jgi:hypothetical protein
VMARFVRYRKSQASDPCERTITEHIVPAFYDTRLKPACNSGRNFESPSRLCLNDLRMGGND